MESCKNSDLDKWPGKPSAAKIVQNGLASGWAPRAAAVLSFLSPACGQSIAHCSYISLFCRPLVYLKENFFFQNVDLNLKDIF